MRLINPSEIQQRSFDIIDSEVSEPRPFYGKKWEIVRRMIHSSADFELLSKVCFHKDAVDSGLNAIKAGAYIITDTKMVLAGLNKKRLKRYGCKLRCFISREEVKKIAYEKGVTRAWASVDFAIPYIDASIYVIGNAPTALIRLLELIEDKRCSPSLIIGMPVGFFNVEEAKERLISQNSVPYITVMGRKGGSTLVVAVINQFLDFL